VFAGFRGGAASLLGGSHIAGTGVVEPRLESDSCEEHGGDQRDGHDLEVRGAAAGGHRVIHRGLLMCCAERIRS
jgi:hypothetical protein